MTDGFTLATNAVRETTRALDECAARIAAEIENIPARERELRERLAAERAAVPLRPTAK